MARVAVCLALIAPAAGLVAPAAPAASTALKREAEIKHGRVAMLAFTGALVQSYGMHFDGKLNGMFFEKGVNPFEATPSAFATNPMGMAQILLFIGLTEGYTFPEGAWSGDMKRDPGDLGYRVMRSADVMEEQQIKELKNGRAAMLGIMAFSSRSRSSRTD